MNPPLLKIQLFGPLQVSIGEDAMPRVRTRSVEWLLALLALRHGRDVERTWLAGTLWPESEESQALQNLRTSLVSLRKALGTESARIKSTTRDLLTLDLTGAEVDVVRFDAAIRAATEDLLTIAVDAYTGPLLEGCYAEWAFAEREMRSRQFLEALETLAERAQERGDHGEAIRLLQRAEAVDPLSDAIIRRLMTSLEATGNPGAAVEAYRGLRNRLHDELSASPDEATSRLFYEIRDRTQSNTPRTRVMPAREPDRQSLRHPIISRPAYPLTRLIGRTQELEAVCGCLTRSRLVTLVGAGGVGKTRLATEVATLSAASFESGAVWIDLAPIADGSLLIPTLATALGLSTPAATDIGALMEQIAHQVSGGAFLLALDNCEHILDAVLGVVGSLINRCPELRVLATSRQRIGLAGETVWRVPSLAVPDTEGMAKLGHNVVKTVLKYAAVELFVERAAMARPEFKLQNDQEASAVARICHRLDGIPLAIELAAARVGVLSVAQIDSRLVDRFRLLTGGSKTSLPRQQTLKALVDWSYDLLSEPERTLLCRLSVFAGGCTLEAVEQVCIDCQVHQPSTINNQPSSLIPQPSTDEVLDLLTGLIDKNLVVAETVGESLRYRLLETVRQYSRDRLLESEGRTDFRERHHSYYLALAEQAADHLHGLEQQEWLDRLDRERDNLRQAITYCLEEPVRIVAGLRMAGSLQHFWYVRGLYREGLEYFNALLTHLDGQERNAIRAKALNGAGVLAQWGGDGIGAGRYYEECLAVAREIGFRPAVAGLLHNLAVLYHSHGDLNRSKSHYEEALQINRELGSRMLESHNLGGLAGVFERQSEYTAAESLLQEALAISRDLRDREAIAAHLHLLGNLSLVQCECVSARSLLQECEAVCRELGHPMRTAKVVHSLGLLSFQMGDYTPARSLCEEALEVCRPLRSTGFESEILNTLGRIAADQGDFDAARTLIIQALAYCQKETAASKSACLYSLGYLTMAQGELSDALTHFQNSLAIREKFGDRRGIAELLEGFAEIALSLSNLSRAGQLWGAAEQIRDEIGAPMPLRQRPHFDAKVAAARRADGIDAFDAAWNEGRTMTVEQAIELVRQEYSD